jgi:DNA polymerase III delta prime subunit
MALSSDQNERLAALAAQLIEGLGAVEAAAQQALRGHGEEAGGGAALAVGQNPMVGPTSGTLHLDRIRQQKRQELSRLRDEPFVAHVLVEDEAGTQRRFYFARSAALAGMGLPVQGTLASYRAPVGRLAEMPAGESARVALPSGTKTYTILERARLRPFNTSDGWDGRDDRIEAGDLLVTVDSLREFLAQARGVPAEATDLLGALLAEVEAATAVRDGVRRRVIARMSLRDQAVLDRHQGDVFRLPIDRRLMLSGPPGTGKTTTLIRRLAQKRSADDIAEEERDLVPPDRVTEFFYPENWIMFTPTDLLKLYLKESFASEGVAASDERVRTWADERRRLSRDVLRILRSERGGRFTLDGETDVLLDAQSSALTALADAFFDFFERYTAEQYGAALDGLREAEDSSLVALVDTARRRVGASGTMFEALFDFTELHELLRDHVERLSAETSDIVKSAINARLVSDRTFLTRLGTFVETVGAEGEDENDDDGEVEEDRPVGVRDPRIVAADVFGRAISARARALADGRTLGRGSRNARVMDWLGDSAPAEAVLRPLGARLVRLRRLRFLASTHRNLIDRVPAVYQRFRRAALRDALWYRADARTVVDRSRVAGAEVDIILLLMLRNARRLLLRQGGRGLREDTRIATLEAIKEQYVTQVLVDEATDFSPVQLGCMLERAHPTFRSFFACGDVRQRVTRWGVRTFNELHWVSSDFEVREIGIGYRQSRTLAALATLVARLGDAEAPSLDVPEYVGDADVLPLLAEGLSGTSRARWLSDRIAEIERTLGSVPSIAVFVDGDDRIDELVEQVRPLLVRLC